MSFSKEELGNAKVRSTCQHVLDLNDPSEVYGRVWEENEAAIVCKPCYDEVGGAVIDHLMRLSSRTRAEAEQFFVEHSLVAEQSLVTESDNDGRVAV